MLLWYNMCYPCMCDMVMLAMCGMLTVFLQLGGADGTDMWWQEVQQLCA